MAPVILNMINYKAYFEKAISYQDYLENFQSEMDGEKPSTYAKYLPQNWQRQSRLDRKLKLNAELEAAIAKLDKPINWLVITEHWCGDASQINPIINKIAEQSNGKIILRFVYRDENEALIDAHLTDGRSRSIPILLQLDEDFNFEKSYGPRPDEAQELVKSILLDGGSYDIPLHTWYAKDKQRSLQSDMIEFLS